MLCIPCCKKKIKIPDDNNYWDPIYHRTLQPSYIFHFGNDFITKIDKGSTIMISSFAPNGLQQCYNFLKFNKMINEYYVACPVYWNAYADIMMDTQLAVTGSCLIGESIIKCVIREVAEELGIVVPHANTLNEIYTTSKQYPAPLIDIQKIKTTKETEITELNNKFIKKENKSKFHDTMYHSYVLDASSGRPYNKITDKLSTGTDDKSKKIQVVVVGKLPDLLHILKNIVDRPPSSDSESIKSVRLLSLKEFYL